MPRVESKRPHNRTMQLLFQICRLSPLYLCLELLQARSQLVEQHRSRAHVAHTRARLAQRQLALGHEVVCHDCRRKVTSLRVRARGHGAWRWVHGLVFARVQQVSRNKRKVQHGREGDRKGAQSWLPTPHESTHQRTSSQCTSTLRPSRSRSCIHVCARSRTCAQ